MVFVLKVAANVYEQPSNTDRKIQKCIRDLISLKKKYCLGKLATATKGIRVGNFYPNLSY